MNAAQTFAAISGQFAERTAVTLGTGFGTNPGLRVHGRIFALLRSGDLVVKLPPPRCAHLVAAGTGTPFDAGRGVPLREWVVVPASVADAWAGLVAEAFDYVGGAAT